jgi:tetratricopeptide (TPR) repeat protein
LFQAAVGDFTTAIEMGSDDAGALGEACYNRGCILTDDLGSHAEAIADFKRTLELLPGHHGALQGLQRATSAMLT